MKTEKILNSEGKPYISKDGNELVVNTFQNGDLFVPKFDNVKITKKTANVDGKDTIIETYTLLCNEVLDVETKTILNDVFIVITPTQYKHIKNKIDEGLEINQYTWKAYEYEIERGKFIGLNINKKFNEPVKLEQ
jgi:hypothetical protein